MDIYANGKAKANHRRHNSDRLRCLSRCHVDGFALREGASRHTALPCKIPSRLDAIFQPSYAFFNPKANPRCVRLLGIIKYLAVPDSFGGCCEYLMSPL